MTFPLPALSQRKPGQGSFAATASPATYQGKQLCNPRDFAGRLAGSAAHPGAASPEHRQVPAGIWGKGRAWDLQVQDKAYRQTTRCFPPAPWDHELRGLGAPGLQGHDFPCEWVSACRTAGSCSQRGGWDSPGWVQGRQRGPRALMVQASRKIPPILPTSSHLAPVTHGDQRHTWLEERGQ